MVTFGFDDDERIQLAKLIAKQVVYEMRGNHKQLDDKLLIPNKKAAVLLGLHVSQLDEIRKLGKIEYVRGVCNRIFFTPAQLQKYIDENTQRGN